MVLSMTLVASYVHVSPPSYRPSLCVGLPTAIDLHAANVLDEVIAVDAIIVINTVVKTKEGTSLASTTDAVITGTLETNTTGQTMLAHDVRILDTWTKNQPPMTNRQHRHQHPYHQVFAQHGATVHSLCSAHEYTIGLRPSIICGCENAVDAGQSQNLLTV